MAPESSPGISVVIPAYNEEKFLPETLASIRKARECVQSERGVATETVVVDNASTDATSAVATAGGSRAIRHEVRNIASVRNAGIREAKHDLVITIDADSFVPPETFVHIWDAMATGKYIGGGVRLGIRSQKRHLRAFVTAMEWMMVQSTGLSGGMFFFRREDALAIGGFPEELLIAEDMTFAKRLRDYGKPRGKKFHNLRSVTVLTFDRKDVSFGVILDSLWKGAKMFAGAKIGKEDLDYWYKPKR